MRSETETLLGIAKLGAQYNLALSGSVSPVLLMVMDSGESCTTSLAASSPEALQQEAQALTTQNAAKVAAVVVAGTDERPLEAPANAVHIHLQQRGEPPTAWIARASGRQLGPWKRSKAHALTVIASIQ